MNQSIKISKLDAFAKSLVKDSFPDYKGRKFSVRSTDSVDITSFWDGGSRSTFTAVDLATGRTVNLPEQAYGAARSPARMIPYNIVIIEHAIFCGKDCGITFHVRPDNLTRLLPAAE